MTLSSERKNRTNATERVETHFKQNIDGMWEWTIEGYDEDGVQTFVGQMVNVPLSMLKTLHDDLHELIEEVFIP